ncbi:MAG: hypothetical protein A3G23_01240 [Bacteroidetes bacterium RIFCSPLOWO2_12_FULL_37_12]|nr:MAG: hypothetical protein A3G23_01240 [Bacteroidetes bacterium RIFCSPLOWO2_12_FULL_37_12]
MGLPQFSRNEKFTYADLLTWPEEERWELIDGVPYDMSPAPRTAHQRVSTNLVWVLENFFRNKKCRVFAAPFDIRLPKEGKDVFEITNVVQPDISIICDPKKIDERGGIGAPELVIEILSESSTRKDIGIKMLLYQNSGVKEYWVVDPDEETITVYLPDKTGKYFPKRTYHKEEIIVLSLFPKCKIKLHDVFW